MTILIQLVSVVASFVAVVVQACGVTLGVLLGIGLTAWAVSGCAVTERQRGDKVKYIIVSPAHVAPPIPPAIVPSGPSN